MKIGYKGISNYSRIDISDAFNIFNKNSNENIFIDVRNEIEWKKGSIPYSLKITLSNLEENLDNLEKSKNYIMVCHYGGRSSLACEIMIKHGFNNIYNFQGGMLEWYDKNYPLEYLS